MKTSNTRRNLIESLLAGVHSEASADQNEMLGEVKDFLDAVPGGFFIYKADDDEQFIYVNKAMLNIMGCETLEQFRLLTNNSFKGLVYHEDLEEIEASILQQIDENQFDMDYVEYRVQRADGQIRWLEDYGHFLHNEQFGDIFYVFVSDATEKINTRHEEKERFIEQNAESERKIKSLLEEYDTVKKHDDRIQLRRLEVIEGLSVNYESIQFIDLDANMIVPYRVSVRARAQFDKELNEEVYSDFVASYVKMWVYPDDREMVAKCFSPEYLKKKLSKEKTFYLNYRCLYQDEIQDIQMRMVNVSKTGCSQIVLGFRNIGDELAQEMQQKQALRDALTNARQAAIAKNIFLSNISHDMRTPLNAISGFVNLARKNLNNPVAIEDNLNKIETAGTQILDLIEKVLALTYTESQGESVEEKECNIAGIVADVVKLLQVKAKRKRIILAQDLSCAADLNVLADEDKIKQVLFQIVDNAVKYTKSGGAVKISVTQTGKQDNGYADYKFIVSDTGIGVSKKFMPRIFEPFERERNSTSSGVFGSGLGLTIAKNHTENMGGAISVESTVGKGSVFTVKLTLKTREEQDELLSDDAVLEEIKRKKILIVEDNEINLEIETEILEDLGFSIDSAENGQVAIDKLKSNPEDYYAVVLMDIQMPIMDGRRATEIIRKFKNPALSRIPIIALSANAFESDVKASLKAGLDAHLAKPLDVNKLLETMAKIVQSRHNS